MPVTDGKVHDEMSLKIKACRDAEEVLDIIPNGKAPMTPDALMAALYALFDLQKTKQ